MDHEFWHQRWQLQEIGFHRDAHHQLLVDNFHRVATEGLVFVPLCGKSKDLLWLLDNGYRVRGLELSAIAIEDFFRDHQLQPEITQRGAFTVYRVDELEIWHGDVFDITAADLADVDAWYDRAALVALPPAMRERYAQLLKRVLPAGAHGLVVRIQYPTGSRQGPPFAVTTAEVQALFGQRFQIETLPQAERFVARHQDITEHALLLY